MGSDFADAGEQAVGYRTNSAMNTGAAILGSCAGRSPAYSALRLVCSALSPPFATDWTVAWADGIPLVVGQLLKRFGLLGVWSGGERSAAPGREREFSFRRRNQPVRPPQLRQGPLRGGAAQRGQSASCRRLVILIQYSTILDWAQWLISKHSLAWSRRHLLSGYLNDKRFDARKRGRTAGC